MIYLLEWLGFEVLWFFISVFNVSGVSSIQSDDPTFIAAQLMDGDRVLYKTKHFMIYKMGEY